MKRLYVEVIGGLVSAIYTDSKEKFEVEILDRDSYEKGSEYYDHDYAEDMERVSYAIEHDETLTPIY